MNAQIFGFEPAPGLQAGPQAGARPVVRPMPEPGCDPAAAGLPEREWGLTAGQVAAVVLAILVGSEVIGVLF